jgi:WD40 repeat protein
VRVWDVNVQRELHRLELPAGSHVSAIVPSPDRAYLFVAAWDNKGAAFWMAWNVATGKVVHREQGLEGAFVGGFVRLAVSPNGETLAAGLWSRQPPEEAGHTEVRVYASPGWKERRRWRAHQGGSPDRNFVAFSPDGKRIATGGADGKVRRWDADTGKELGQAIETPVLANNVAYLNADTLFTFEDHQTVKLWDARTGKPKLAFPGSEAQVTALAYSPDGRHVAVSGGDGDPTIRVWEASSGKQVAQLRDGMLEMTCLCFSPDGRLVVSGGWGGARLWDWAKGGAPVKTLAGPGSSLHSIAFSPDGKSLATGDNAGIVRVWAVTTSKPIYTLKGHAFEGHMPRVSALAFAPDGQALFSGSLDHGIRHWDLATGKEVRLIRGVREPDARWEPLGHSTAVSGLAVSPGGRWVYSAGYDQTICVWEVASGRLARVLKEQEPGYNGPVKIALSPDGTRLAAAFVNDWEHLSVPLWDLTTGEKVAGLAGHRAPVTQLAFSPDGRQLASGSGDTTALVWDVTQLPKGERVPDSKVLAALWDNLGADDSKTAYGAVCQGAAGADAAVARLKLKLTPAIAIDTAKVAAWVRQLDSDDFAERTKASEALARLGPDAEAALRGALAKAGTLEVKQRLDQILQQQEAQHRHLGYAVEVLEMIGTPPAGRLLTDLANGAGGSRLTRAARAALERLKKRS